MPDDRDFLTDYRKYVVDDLEADGDEPRRDARQIPHENDFQ